jgi:hypothetical protein
MLRELLSVPTPKRDWFQFRLRRVFWFITLVAILCVFWQWFVPRDEVATSVIGSLVLVWGFWTWSIIRKNST